MATCKADLVTMINFESAATLDYPLGDPGGANSSLDKIGWMVKHILLEVSRWLLENTRRVGLEIWPVEVEW